MLPVVLIISLFAAAAGTGYLPPQPLPKKVVSVAIPKAVVKGKPLRRDSAFDHHQVVPIKKTEVRRVIEKVPLVHEVPIIITKNKPFYQPQVVPRPIVVHEVVGLPIVRDKHVVQPVYVDRPYVVEKKQFVDQPYPVHKPVPIDFIKRVTKVFDRKVEVPHFVNIPLVKTVDKPRPVPYTREVVQMYDVHVNVPRPRPVKVFRHRTHVQKVPFETQNLIVRKRPVHHSVNEYIPKVPQGFNGRVLAGTQEDAAVTAEARRFGPASGGRTISVRRGPGGPVAAPQRGPVLLNVQTVDAATGQRVPDGAAAGRGARVGPGRVVGVSASRQAGAPVLLGQDISGPGVASLGPVVGGGPGIGGGAAVVDVGGGGGGIGGGVVLGGGGGGGGGGGAVVLGGGGGGGGGGGASGFEVVDIGDNGEGVINLGPGGGVGEDIEIIAVGPDGKNIGSFVLDGAAVGGRGGGGKKGK